MLKGMILSAWIAVALVWVMPLLPRPAGAGSFTGATTDAQDAAIQRNVDRANAAITVRNAENAAFNRANPSAPQRGIAPLWTRDSYLEGLWSGVMDALVREWRASMPNLSERWKTMTDADRVAICSKLGVSVAECPK